jgi:deoxyribodipyrimidine photo-lyase
MVKKYNKSIFIFRRDLRLNDNTALIEALDKSKNVIPIFIFTPEQLENNQYKSDNSVQFMMESLDELDDELKNKGSKLFYFYGKPHTIISKLLKKYKDIDAVFVNMDYTPYSLKRDIGIEKECLKNYIDFIIKEDILLNPVGSIRTKSKDKIYTKFTPYFNRARLFDVRKPQKNNYKNYYSKYSKLVGEYKKDKHDFYKKNEDIVVNGGRKNALKIIKDVNDFRTYNKDRNTLKLETTRLSAYIKFGSVSIREVYKRFKDKLGTKNDLIKQLYWRDFYYNITYEYPESLGKIGTNRNLSKEYSNIPWITSSKASKKQKDMFEKWKNGKTGYPAVDACMREINTIGYMHNRGRLIVASFLTKQMMWHWEEGEKYFAKSLVDYDPSVNNGNWQFCSGSGVDSQPYFRIFNPWLQSEKFDKQCEYIKKWIPELKDVESKHIHKWNEYWDHENYEDINYPKPILDHSKARENTLKKFKKALY